MVIATGPSEAVTVEGSTPADSRVRRSRRKALGSGRCRQLLQVVFAIRAIIAVAMVAKRQRASLFAAAHGVCALASGAARRESDVPHASRRRRTSRSCRCEQACTVKKRAQIRYQTRRSASGSLRLLARGPVQYSQFWHHRQRSRRTGCPCPSRSCTTRSRARPWTARKTRTRYHVPDGLLPVARHPTRKAVSRRAMTRH